MHRLKVAAPTYILIAVYAVGFAVSNWIFYVSARSAYGVLVQNADGVRADFARRQVVAVAVCAVFMFAVNSCVVACGAPQLSVHVTHAMGCIVRN